MTAGAPTIGGLGRLDLLMGGQYKHDVEITGGTISNTTIADADFTGVDINSGTIDGTPIGATTPSTGAFTTLSASGTAQFTGNIIGIQGAGEFVSYSFSGGNTLGVAMAGESGYAMQIGFVSHAFTDSGTELTNGGLTLTNSFLSMRVQDGSTAASFVNYGLTKFGDESTSAATYTMTAPSRPGLFKMLRSEQGDTLVKTVNLQAGINDSTTLTRLTFDTNGESVFLMSESTSAWSVISNNGNVGYSS